MQALPGSMSAPSPPGQVILLVHVGATAKGSGATVPQPVIGYPAAIQLCSAAISVGVAAGEPTGGIGLVVLVIRVTAIAAFVTLGSDFAGAVRSAKVTSDIGTPGSGVAP
jgi:hypothetical protein